LAVAILAAAAGGAAGQGQALPPVSGASAPPVGVARPVPGWRVFCEQHPDDCNVDPDEPDTVTLSREVWQQILAVNARVNASVRPLGDDTHWGVVDSWDYPTDGFGDCEDYQLLKRKLLVEAGLPRRALRITVVIDERGEGHAVLMVRTDRGEFILDNKTKAVLPWYKTGYVFVKREGSDGAGWISLGGATSPVTTANR
jgi:predicted transglutaminase-like cysteine proteinase